MTRETESASPRGCRPGPRVSVVVRLRVGPCMTDVRGVGRDDVFFSYLVHSTAWDTLTTDTTDTRSVSEDTQQLYRLHAQPQDLHESEQALCMYSGFFSHSPVLCHASHSQSSCSFSHITDLCTLTLLAAASAMAAGVSGPSLLPSFFASHSLNGTDVSFKLPSFAVQ